MARRSRATDYEPLDLSAYCNAGSEALGDGEVSVGARTFHGLPFLVGGTPEKGVTLLDAGTPSLTLPVGRTARRLIIAHRIVGSESQPPGTLVGEYVFRLAGGAEIRAPVRERLEIQVVPAHWGLAPFLARPQGQDGVFERYEGRFEWAGARQTEVMQGSGREWWLWTWENPKPEDVIDSVELVFAGRPFAVAAITVGNADEAPFPRAGRREVRIDLTDPELASAPFALSVEVDRGVATYAQPLPHADVEEFLADPMRGWGEALNASSTPAYVRVAAVPSATLAVRHGRKRVGRVRWGELERKGAVRAGRARVELRDPGRNWVRVTVLDDTSGRPVPCRVHFRSPDGIPYQPHGHHDHVNSNQGTWHVDVGGDVRLGQITYAYIDGTCQGWLPRGDVIVDVARGFEYEPLRERVRIEPGQRELALRLRRWTDMNAAGWWSGDSHVHFLSTVGSLREQRAEDLNVVNLLQSQWGHLYTSTEEFTGSPAVSQDGRYATYVGQENRQHVLGHLILWGLREPVMPWCSDGPNEAELGGTMDVTMSHWADACHEQGGTVIVPHFPAPYGEQGVLIATDRADGVEMLAQNPMFHEEYYRFLNLGYRLPIVGGTDKMDNAVPVGLYRTYAFLGDDEFSYDAWVRAVRAGRTFLSGGPMMGLEIDGRGIGEMVELAGPGTVEVHAWSESIFPIHTLQLVQQGKVVASSEDASGARRLEVRTQLRVDEHTWFAARSGGPGYFDGTPHRDAWARNVCAHTSPIYVACGGAWELFDPAEAERVLTVVDGALAYVREMTRQYPPGTVTHHHGHDDHMAYLERPFLEAQQKLNERLSVAGAAVRIDSVRERG